MSRTIKIPLPKEEKNESPLQVEIKEGELHITGIPESDKLYFLARDVETRSIYVIMHGLKENPDNKNPRFHIGREKEMHEADVRGFETYLNGGAIILKYLMDGSLGTFEQYDQNPETGFTPNPVATYKGKTITLESLL